MAKDKRVEKHFNLWNISYEKDIFYIACFFLLTCNITYLSYKKNMTESIVCTLSAIECNTHFMEAFINKIEECFYNWL